MNSIAKLAATVACGLALSACGGENQSSCYYDDDDNYSCEYTVSPSVINGLGGTIHPSKSVLVDEGDTASFTITPDPGYRIASIDGTCSGTLNGNIFKTDKISKHCTVIVEFAVDGP